MRRLKLGPFGKWAAKPAEFAIKHGYKIIECYRNSTNSRPNYVRESWLTEEVWKSCNSIKRLPITPGALKLSASINEEFEPGRRTEQIKGQLDKAIKTPKTEVKADAALWEWKKGFVDTVEAIWRKQIAVGYRDRGGLLYDVSAEAQFMRFASGLALSDSVDAVSVIKDRHMTLGNMKAAATLDIFSAQMNARLLLPDSCGAPVEISFYSGAEEKLTKHTFGHVIFDLQAMIGGYIGASCSLSANISIGADTGKLGVRGRHTVSTSVVNYDPHRNRTVPMVKVGAIEKKQPGVQAHLDLFAGIKVGGSFSGNILWKPAEGIDKGACTSDLTAAKKDWISLCSLETSLAVAVGAGAKLDFCVTLAQGRLAVAFAARVIWGPGAEGAVGFTVDLVSINALINYLLKVLAREDFRRLAIFDDSNGSTYRYIEHLLTAHLVTGIALTKLALLPIEVLEKINKSSLRQENAPIIASYITGKDENGNPIARGPNWERDREAWFDNLLPEVKGKLLHLLLTEQGNWFITKISSEAKSHAQKQEANQRAAIVTIIGWISNEEDARYRQYEETLVRCKEDGLKPTSPVKHQEEIDTALVKIKEFFDKRDLENADENRNYQMLLTLHKELYVNRPRNPKVFMK